MPLKPDEEPEDLERGRKAYEEFRAATAETWLVTGHMRPWDQLEPETQRAWQTTAMVINRRAKRRVN